jgi:hypothetical protein
MQEKQIKKSKKPNGTSAAPGNLTSLHGTRTMMAACANTSGIVMYQNRLNRLKFQQIHIEPTSPTKETADALASPSPRSKAKTK